MTIVTLCNYNQIISVFLHFKNKFSHLVSALSNLIKNRPSFNLVCVCVHRLEKEVKDKDNELETVLRELGRMKAKVVEQQEEIQKKTSMSSSE